MTRINYTSGTVWEQQLGYSRAVRVGPIIEVTGTVAVNDQNEVVGKDNAYEQTKFILAKIRKVIEEAGGQWQDVVRTRFFVTDIDQWEAYGIAHAECFGDIRPCLTMVEVSRLIGKDYLVEVEATAILP
jgi:enamine deaminase RidA (YjgF/YER057c/UK114 family)